MAEAPPLQAVPDCDLLGAFYSEKLPGPGRAGRVVVLNTNLYYTNNEQTAGMADPGEQFQWLGDVLSNASRHGETVSALPVHPDYFLVEIFHQAQTYNPTGDTHTPEVLQQPNPRRGLTL